MSFDATNPEHHDHFTELVFRAFENNWLGNAMQQSMAKEGRSITRKQEQNIRKKAEQNFREWLAATWQDGHDTALMQGQSENPYEQENQ